jgi:hypothetical protein
LLLSLCSSKSTLAAAVVVGVGVVGEEAAEVVVARAGAAADSRRRLGVVAVRRPGRVGAARGKLAVRGKLAAHAPQALRTLPEAVVPPPAR